MAKLRYYLNSQEVKGIIEGKRNSDIVELMIGRKIYRLVKTHLGKLPFALNLPHHFFYYRLLQIDEGCPRTLGSRINGGGGRGGPNKRGVGTLGKIK